MDLQAIAKSEGLDLRKLKKSIRNGRAVFVKNTERNIEPLGIGEGLHTKVNANIGASPMESDSESEIRKGEISVRYGADTVMDLTVGKDIDRIRKNVLKNVKVPVGTVPIYQAFAEKKYDIDQESVVKVIEKQARDGVDFMTIHAGITLDIAERLKEKDRTIPITSRGGAILGTWMAKKEEENPLITGFDDILEICREYNVVISLGDAMRPATIFDANDYYQDKELENLGKLTLEARKVGVQIIIEGPGHMPLNTIVQNVVKEKKLCHGAPYYVLGPLVTDTALGYDHISGAIGGAVAAAAGVDFLCYVTPAEHIGLPSDEDVKRGVIASKIAARAADIVKLGDTRLDKEVTEARKGLDWKSLERFAMDECARDRIRKSKDKQPCSMCGELCAIKICEEVFG